MFEAGEDPDERLLDVVHLGEEVHRLTQLVGISLLHQLHGYMYQHLADIQLLTGYRQGHDTLDTYSYRVIIHRIQTLSSYIGYRQGQDIYCRMQIGSGYIG